MHAHEVAKKCGKVIDVDWQRRGLCCCIISMWVTLVDHQPHQARNSGVIKQFSYRSIGYSIPVSTVPIIDLVYHATDGFQFCCLHLLPQCSGSSRRPAVPEGASPKITASGTVFSPTVQSQCFLEYL